MTNDRLIRFRCSGCGKRIQAKPESVGKQLACPNCEGPITVPHVTDTGQPSIPVPPLRPGSDRADSAQADAVNARFKNCPYCGEEISATAVKCKHCHEVLTQPPHARLSSSPSPSATSAQIEQAPDCTKDFVGASVLTLLLYFLFWLPGVMTNVIYLRYANRIKASTGREPVGRGLLIVLLWLFGVGMPVALLVLMLLAGYAIHGVFAQGDCTINHVPTRTCSR